MADATGMSKSTLSRLDTRQRRPTMELLLLPAQASRVPLDDLGGAPALGDPRIRLAESGARTHVVPLTAGPEGSQARKIALVRQHRPRAAEVLSVFRRPSERMRRLDAGGTAHVGEPTRGTGDP